MISPISGIHHITAIASDPQDNLDFYHAILGQRLIKTTVNFDDPGTYHFYFGDYTGSPGTIMTFFPWPNARRGEPGNGQVAVTAYTIPASAMDYWLARFRQFNVQAGNIQERFGKPVIPFQDRDGLLLELAVEDNLPEISSWADGPIPASHALCGFHSATLWVWEADKITRLLTEQMGYTLVGEEANRLRFETRAGSLGSRLDLLVRKGAPAGRGGAGTVHHIAFRNQDDAEQLMYRQQLLAAGYEVTPVRDRQYFHSIYFRESNGILFEFATNPPGFTLDETPENLGAGLRLPPWIEPQRKTVEAILPPITRRIFETPVME